MRIVSLVPSLTELLFTLGLGRRVVGRTSFCVHPREEVAGVIRVGGTKKVRLERLRRLAPTHVVLNIDENTREAAEAIAEFVPHVIVTHPLGPRDNPGLYRLLGGVFDRERAAQRLCDAFWGAFDALEASARRLPPRRVLYLIWRRPWMTVSADTYIARTLGLVKWQTVPAAATVRYPEVRLDRALLAGTDVVLLSSEPYPFRDRHLAEVRAQCDAAHRGSHHPRLALIDGEMTSWYGSRAIAGLEYLRAFAPALLARAE